MREASKKKKILKLYIQDLKININELAVLSDSNLQYVKQCVRDYHIDLVSYEFMCIAPSYCTPGTYYLFNENGTERALKKVGDTIYPEHQLTDLEELFIRLNLCKRIVYNED